MALNVLERYKSKFNSKKMSTKNLSVMKTSIKLGANHLIILSIVASEVLEKMSLKLVVFAFILKNYEYTKSVRALFPLLLRLIVRRKPNEGRHTYNTN